MSWGSNRQWFVECDAFVIICINIHARNM